MKFFRVENNEKRGPYNNGCGLSVIDVHGNIDKYLSTHPSPMNDPLLNNYWENMSWNARSEYRFGCNSLEQLICWFDTEEDWMWLCKHKYHISVYEVNFLLSGETQAMCHESQLKEIKKIISFDKNDKNSIYYI